MTDPAALADSPFSSDEFFARLEAGELSTAEQRRFAEALRHEPALRRRLRARLQTSALFQQAAQSPVAVHPRLATSQPSTTATRTWPLALAAALVLGIGAWGIVAATSGTSHDLNSNQPDEPVVADGPPETVNAAGPFTMGAQRGALTIAHTSQIELEAGSSGDVSHTPTTPSVVRLDSGGARLRATAGGGPVWVQTGPAKIIVDGDAEIRYLDVPDGARSAVEVAVAHGSARVESPGLANQILRVGDSHVVAPDGTLKARITRIDPDRHTIQLSAGQNRHRWVISTETPPPVFADGAPFPLTALDPEWRFEVRIDPATGGISRIDIPVQTREVTVQAWNQTTRILRTRRGTNPTLDDWVIADGVTISPAMLDHLVRLTYSPTTRVVSKISLKPPRSATDEHRKPAAAHP